MTAQMWGDMENIPPPETKIVPGMPEKGKGQGIFPFTRSIKSAATAYKGSCTAGDSFKNNCAHFLSDAFVRVGYAELTGEGSCITVHCYTSSKRPIRARELWCWFQKKASVTASVLTRGTGTWAVFQLDEAESPSGKFSWRPRTLRGGAA